MSKGEFYRWCRILHGYISAFAFLALMFFSVTGILLNHPDYFEGRRGSEAMRTVQLGAAAVKTALAAKDQGEALAEAVRARTPLVGRYARADIEDGEAFLRFEGPKGASDVVVNLSTGAAEATVRHSKPTTVLNELHRGRNAGAVWRWAIDISAALFVLLSVIGYVLFFSLRFRLVPSLLLTLGSLVAIVGLVWLFVA